MYELAGGRPSTSWTLGTARYERNDNTLLGAQEDIISYRKLYIIIVLWSYPKKILSHTEIYCLYGLVQDDIISYRNLLFVWSCPKKILYHTENYKY